MDVQSMNFALENKTRTTALKVSVSESEGKKELEESTKSVIRRERELL